MNSLAELLKYDIWANERTLTALESLEPSQVPQHTKKLIAHILGAGSTWLSRITGVPSGLAIWPDLTLAECRDWQEKLAAGFSPIVERSESDLAETIGFKNSAGVGFTHTIHEVLLQVLTHGCYHRGQIARELRLAGLEPVNTDYITMLRLAK